ncbi:MAG: zinc metallopeptidase [Planctomycetes bacterium]|nr:zinc metallopeptidase [Planctomycetota bacterium]
MLSFFFFFDPLYLLFVAPGMLLALWAQVRVKAAVAKWSQVAAGRGMTGADAAAAVLRSANINDVQIESIEGVLTDHYDPTSKTLRLSQQNHDGRSVAAFGIAAHEAGHAIQHATGYALLNFRSSFVPLASFGSGVSMFLLMIGMALLSMSGGGSKFGEMIMFAGILLFSLMVIFTLVTVPVEIDASRRAVKALDQLGLLTGEEGGGAREVLHAAAWTYVAAALTAILQLLYYIMIFMNSTSRSRNES